MFGKLFGGNAAEIMSINPRQAQERLAADAGKGTVILIDVREPWEYRRGHARGARNIPLSQLGRRTQEVPADCETLLICQSGHRSMQAAKILQEAGRTRIVNITGGTTVWKMHNLPME